MVLLTVESIVLHAPEPLVLGVNTIRYATVVLLTVESIACLQVRFREYWTSTAGQGQHVCQPEPSLLSVNTICYTYTTVVLLTVESIACLQVRFREYWTSTGGDSTPT